MILHDYILNFISLDDNAYFTLINLVKPRIDRTNLKQIIVKSGKPVFLDVDVKGEPPPKIIWIFKEKEVNKYYMYLDVLSINKNTKYLITLYFYLLRSQIQLLKLLMLIIIQNFQSKKPKEFNLAFIKLLQQMNMEKMKQKSIL